MKTEMINYMKSKFQNNPGALNYLDMQQSALDKITKYSNIVSDLATKNNGIISINTLAKIANDVYMTDHLSGGAASIQERYKNEEVRPIMTGQSIDILL